MKHRRFHIGAFGLIALAVGLLGARHTASAPAPIGTATPVPAYTATPVPVKAAVPPSVVVYPFETTGEMPKNAGLAISQLFDQQLTLGGLHVVKPPNNVPRTDYLNAARANKADYYISGYLTPLGDGAAMVVQVVTADSGIMIFSKTVEIFTTNDAAAQADAMQQVMLEHSGQLADYAQPEPSATPQPESSSGSSVPLGGILGIFKHGGKTDSSELAPAVLSQDKPDRVVIVARVSGTGIDAGMLTSATQMLAGAMNRYYHAQLDHSNTSDVAASADTICGSNRNATIAGGTLAQLRSGHASDSFTLRVYTCFGAVLYEGSAVSGSSIQDVVERAASAYAVANPTNS